MVEDDQSNDLLPANRALIVQFRPAATGGKFVFAGRVEHLTSGNVHYFSSQQELNELFHQLLNGAKKRIIDNDDQANPRW
ncbi:MAG: hypothetical protein ACR2P1_07845 [Pseudomonadales bacterium]